MPRLFRKLVKTNSLHDKDEPPKLEQQEAPAPARPTFEDQVTKEAEKLRQAQTAKTFEQRVQEKAAEIAKQKAAEAAEKKKQAAVAEAAAKLLEQQQAEEDAAVLAAATAVLENVGEKPADMGLGPDTSPAAPGEITQQQKQIPDAQEPAVNKVQDRSHAALLHLWGFRNQGKLEKLERFQLCNMKVSGLHVWLHGKI